MPNSVRGPTLARKEALISGTLSSGGKVAIRLASNDLGSFANFDVVTITGSTHRDGTYTIQSSGSDGTGAFHITTTTHDGGTDASTGVLTGPFKPANKITADTSNNIDMRELSGGIFQIASRSSGGGGGNTLDAAYDQGGAGSGRSITADSGAVSITGDAALSVVGTHAGTLGCSIENSGTDATVPALYVASLDLAAADSPVVKVSARTNPGLALVDIMQVTGEAIVTPKVTSASSTDLLLQGHVNTTVAGGTGKVNLSPASGQAAHVDSGDGFAVGHVPTTLNNFSASVGLTHVASIERSLVVGQTNTAQDDSLAVGESCTAAVDSIALGHSANAALYAGGRVLAMAANNDVGGTPSPNTLVLDAAAQIPGSPAAPIAPGSAGPGSGVGNIYLDSGGVYSGGADYAEMFEWNDGNSNGADRRGFFVSLVNGNKIEAGNSNVVGVVSASPAVIGDAADLSWQGKYERDEFGGMVYQMVDGRRSPKPSSTYNPTQSYTPRRGRKEWAPVGLVGKLYVRSAQALTAGSKCSANSSGYAVNGNDYHILRVIRQPTSSKYGIIEILMK